MKEPIPEKLVRIEYSIWGKVDEVFFAERDQPDDFFAENFRGMCRPGVIHSIERGVAPAVGGKG